MTYAPLPINERTFKLIAAAGVLSLLAAGAAVVFQPNELGQPIAMEVAANDVTSTGSIVQNGGTRREWVDPIRQ
jgi:hypothetical protein